VASSPTTTIEDSTRPSLLWDAVGTPRQPFARRVRRRRCSICSLRDNTVRQFTITRACVGAPRRQIVNSEVLLALRPRGAAHRPHARAPARAARPCQAFGSGRAGAVHRAFLRNRWPTAPPPCTSAVRGRILCNQPLKLCIHRSAGPAAAARPGSRTTCGRPRRHAPAGEAAAWSEQSVAVIVLT